MKKSTALNLSALVVVSVFILNLLASYLHLYWSLFWFDMLMHFLGGIFIGLILYVLFHSQFVEFTTRKGIFFILLIAGTLFVGFLWEVMEFLLDNFFASNLAPDVSDTVSDLFFAMLGGLTASFVVYKRNAFPHA